MAQHGRLVVSCTGTLHVINTTNHSSFLCEDPKTRSVEKKPNKKTPKITVSSQCIFIIAYSPSDQSDKVAKLCFNSHMQLAQGQFIHLSDSDFFFFLGGAFPKNHTVWQLQLVLWQNVVWFKVFNFVEKQIWIR